MEGRNKQDFESVVFLSEPHSGPHFGNDISNKMDYLEHCGMMSHSPLAHFLGFA